MKGYKPYFIKAIQHHFSDGGAMLIEQMDAHYHIISKDTHFALTSKKPVDKRLDFTAYFLALIKTLDEWGRSQKEIRSICLEVVLDYVQPKSKLHAYLKTQPSKFMNTLLSRIILPVFNKKVSHNDNKGGFVANIFTDKAATYGFGYSVDIVECGTCKLFNKHHYERYASILCEVDEVTSRIAGLQLIRTGTIALGAN